MTTTEPDLWYKFDADLDLYRTASSLNLPFAVVVIDTETGECRTFAVGCEAAMLAVWESMSKTMPTGFRLQVIGTKVRSDA